MIWPILQSSYILTSLLKLGRSLHNFQHNCSVRLESRHHVLSVKPVKDLELKTPSKIVFQYSLKIHHLASFTLDSFKYTRQLKKKKQKTSKFLSNHIKRILQYQFSHTRPQEPSNIQLSILYPPPHI